VVAFVGGMISCRSGGWKGVVCNVLAGGCPAMGDIPSGKED